VSSNESLFKRIEAAGGALFQRNKGMSSSPTSPSSRVTSAGKMWAWVKARGLYAAAHVICISIAQHRKNNTLVRKQRNPVVVVRLLLKSKLFSVLNVRWG